MATLRDVARAAGVSPATASRALAQPDRVSAERRERVVRAARRLGYAPARPAPRPEPAATGPIGLVVPDVQNPFFAGIAKGVQERARGEGRSVLVADADEDPRLESEILARLADEVSGVVLCSARMPDRTLRTLTTLPGAPDVLLVNREADHLPTLLVDVADGARQAVRHLHALGHRRVAYAGGPAASWSDRERRRALERAAQDLPGLEVVPLGHHPPVFAGGVAAADLVAASRATAVVAYNDLVALGVLDRLRSRGVRVPEDVSVVGADDVPAATQVSPALTTVSVPLRLVGRTAVDLLLDPHHDDDAGRRAPHVVPVSLVVRGSTAPPAR